LRDKASAFITLYGFVRCDAVVERDERQSDIVGHSRQLPHPFVRASEGVVRAHNLSTLSPEAPLAKLL
jgi:hypothetical protein